MTLAEVLISMGIFVILSLAMAEILRQATKIWARAAGSSVSQSELRKARTSLTQEIQRSAFSQTAVAAGPLRITGGGREGDSLWFLSARDPVSGKNLRKSDGTPFWQCNVLYYLATPADHLALYGSECPGGADGNGYDDRCPHKMLIRKEIDFATPTDVNNEASEETLIPAAQIGAYVTRPNGFNLSFMSAEAGLKSAHVLAHSLLFFGVTRAPQVECPREVRVDLRAVSITAARKEVAMGITPLGSSHFTTRMEISLFPALP